MTSQKLDSRAFGKLISALNLGKFAMPVLSNGPEVFAENFSKNSSIEDSGISLNAFPSRTYRKLHIYVTPMLVKKGHNRP